MARSEDAEVILYYVLGIGEDWFSDRPDLNPAGAVLDNQRRRLEAFVRQKFSDYANLVEIRQIVELGLPYQNIVEKAAQEEVDLIIMSTHGRTGLNHMLLGSVTEKVVARASCPVLAVPSPERTRAATLAA
jgi:nucleotide-binding universal stress UspA family protein